MFLADPPDANVASDAHWERLVGAPSADLPRGPARVLVVDDDDSMRRAFERLLRTQGHDVVTVGDGELALAYVQEQTFDVVMLDMNMPGMSGLEVLAQLRSLEQGAELPVLLCSAKNETDDVVRSIELGADDYLVKPPRPQFLFARVKAAIERKQARDQQRAYLDHINRERRRADALLESLFPARVVQEFRDTGMVQSRRHEEVAVLFCDVVDFTAWCDRHDPEEVVTTLQRLVQRLEQLADVHGLLKIKTVGDAFMATAGLFEHHGDPVVTCLAAAEDMIRAVRELAVGWEIRVGVHVGPVVSGIIGLRQYQFDVWGDTVNIASRVEGFAQPGTVALSTAAWERVKNRPDAESLGRVEVKGKGPMDLYIVRPSRSS